MGASRHAWITDGEVLVGLAAVEWILQAVAGAGGRAPQCHAQLLTRRSKRLRPAVTLLAARLGGCAVGPEVVRAAAGVELLHEATLYHDDIVDEAPVRRGAASAQAACGAATAALAGSELLYASVACFAELPAALRRAAGRCGERLCRGQLRELELVGEPGVTVRDRVRVMRDKTASLFELATRLGATLGGVGPRERARVVRFGRFLGLGFQLADDLRDLLLSAEALGRPRFGDLRDGVYTLPAVYVLTGRGLARTVLRCRLGSSGDQGRASTPEDVVRIIRVGGGVERAAEQLRTWVEAARACLPEERRESQAAQDLCRLADGLLEHAGVEGPTARCGEALAASSGARCSGERHDAVV